MHSYYKKPIGIIYGHDPQVNPLFKALFRRGIDFEIINPADHQYDPALTELPYSLVFNDMSSPLYQEKKTSTLYALEFLKHVEKINASSGRIINGTRSSEILASRSKQLSIFSSLGMSFPKTKIVSSTDQLLAATNNLKFPIIIKDNQLNGSFATQVFENMNELIMALVDNKLTFNAPKIILIQEYVAPKADHIVRIEVVNGKVLYAVRIVHVPNKFSQEIKVQYIDPPLDIIDEVENISRVALLDVGSVEYLTDRKTNRIFFTGIRPHTNQFSTDDESKVDVANHLADYIETRYQKVRQIALAI